MDKKQFLKLIFVVISLITAVACANQGMQPVVEIVRVFVTATPDLSSIPSWTPPPTETPTQTLTPTLTPTPTPTAMPVDVIGDPLAGKYHAPTPGPGARCGLVDMLDFPLDPPDGLNAFGGRDFGVYRSRYSKYHTGEDWGTRNRSNFGAPVYSIGHGMVTFAAPEGWGADKGVVIVRHVFPDGSSILSFYGHLDPPSIVLRTGDCVVRGEQIGRIGRPRTPPHLHFEIRSHLPVSPGPGYWSVDPATAGWISPSLFIWEYRIASSPGVEWTQSISDQPVQDLGLLSEDTYTFVDGQDIVGVAADDGHTRWTHSLSETLTTVRLDADRRIVYVLGRSGMLQALRVPELLSENYSGPSEAALGPIWTENLAITGNATLLPLSGGGVVVSTRTGLVAISPEGDRLWRQASFGRLYDWSSLGDQIVLTTLEEGGAVWVVDQEGGRIMAKGVAGHVVVSEGKVLIYAEDGVYRINPDNQELERIYALPRAYLRLGDIVALPQGGALIAHVDGLDQRLIALSTDGNLFWERSLSDISRGGLSLMTLDEEVYLVTRSNSSSQGLVDIFQVDISRPELRHIFFGGTRNPVSAEYWLSRLGENQLLVNIGGEILVALDPQIP
jgi:murein DD-endopeptidase MepM/ murein hydrolase activator NlpD